jgi:hypothetical protein
MNSPRLAEPPELPMQISDGQERLDALGPRLADANQNAGRERHAQIARKPQRIDVQEVIVQNFRAKPGTKLARGRRA